MTITFLNAGQGDSIVLEWEDKSINKIAIIDANVFNGTNPTLDYVKQKGVKRIEYIILSHPHYDHYSGLNQFLEYCNDNSLRIGYFLHTAEMNPDYLSMASRSAVAERELQRLFYSLRSLNPDIVEEVCSLQANQPGNPIIPLSNTTSIKVLAPSSDERDRYIRDVPLFNGEGPHNNPCANWLSTVLKIESNKGYALLTSDSNVYTLKKIGRQFSHYLNGNLDLGQAPHHGSKGNHLESFWRLRNHKNGAPIAISVGENTYGHPEKSVIDSFQKLNYKVSATNFVGGFTGKPNKSKVQKSVLLNQFSQNLTTSSKKSNSTGNIAFTL